jgi:hypothetical protein
MAVFNLKLIESLTAYDMLNETLIVHKTINIKSLWLFKIFKLRETF